jgi:hypothetical protein
MHCTCGDVLRLEDVAEHVRIIHGEDLERWPDGTPVLWDTTLEPAEF